MRSKFLRLMSLQKHMFFRLCTWAAGKRGLRCLQPPGKTQ